MIKNKFAKWIEWLLDLLPLFAVLFSCLYVTFNKNAYLSYDSERLVNTIPFGNSGTLYDGDIYNFEYNNGTPVNNPKVFYSDIDIDWDDYNAPSDNYVAFLINDHNYIYLYTDTTSAPSTTLQNVWGNTLTSLTFTKNNGNANVTNNTNIVVKELIFKNDTLENVFTYSLSKFNDLGFDKLNFTNWFINLFTQGNNNVYTTFINGYLNYFLLVECTYVLPMVLYWFIHLGERLINKLEDVGGIDK